MACHTHKSVTLHNLLYGHTNRAVSKSYPSETALLFMYDGLLIPAGLR